MQKIHLRSTLSGMEYPFERLEEFADNGESLEVVLPWIPDARPRPGERSWERFAEFLPFRSIHPELSLGETVTPLVDAGADLKSYCGVERLLLKNETVNPTWSFKDRGSLACAMMAVERGEKATATISTGNMGHSMAAYGARAGLDVIVFLPDFAPREKELAMAIHGAKVLRVRGAEYADMKLRALSLAARHGLRIVSGNGPVRAEGYKLEAFELYEQLGGEVPDLIVVPTSACGHVRGIFKGFRELKAAGLADRLPRMAVAQAEANSPLATAIRAGSRRIVPFRNFSTVAEALTSGNPPGGEEILDKALEFGWLGAGVPEEAILEAQLRLARAGFFVEPGSAVALGALRMLRREGRVAAGDRVVIVLTGSGMKDMGVVERHGLRATECALDETKGPNGAESPESMESALGRLLR